MRLATLSLLLTLTLFSSRSNGVTPLPSSRIGTHTSDLDRKRAQQLASQALDFLDQRRFPEAESKLREAIAIVPDKATWVYNLACVQSLQGNSQGALDSLE